MFADYRVPQMLNSMGCLYYSPPLDAAVRAKKDIPSGGSWEMQLRGTLGPRGFVLGDCDSRADTPDHTQPAVSGALS